MACLVPYPAVPMMAPAAAALASAMAAEMRNTGKIPPRWWRRCHRRLPRFMSFFLNDKRDGALFLLYPSSSPSQALPRPRLRRGGVGDGLGMDVRVEVRRTEGSPPPSLETVVTVLVCVMFRIRLPRARC